MQKCLILFKSKFCRFFSKKEVIKKMKSILKYSEIYKSTNFTHTTKNYYINLYLTLIKLKCIKIETHSCTPHIFNNWMLLKILTHKKIVHLKKYLHHVKRKNHQKIKIRTISHTTTRTLSSFSSFTHCPSF